MIQDGYKTLTRQRPSTSGDSKGGSTITWSETYTFRGKIQELSGSEALMSDRVTGNQRSVLYTNDTTLLITDRVKDGSNVYEIQNINAKNDMWNSLNHYEISLVKIT